MGCCGFLGWFLERGKIILKWSMNSRLIKVLKKKKKKEKKEKKKEEEFFGVNSAKCTLNPMLILLIY